MILIGTLETEYFLVQLSDLVFKLCQIILLQLRLLVMASHRQVWTMACQGEKLSILSSIRKWASQLVVDLDALTFYLMSG